ncbi:hypothetical protein EGM97_18375 [Pseudomonas sp. AF32]|nr:hypothetical protein [Pseudomonas sp. AF32]
MKDGVILSPDQTTILWRGDLSPLGCAAAPKPDTAVNQMNRASRITTASQPSGDKSPRHRLLSGSAFSYTSTGTDSFGSPSGWLLASKNRNSICNPWNSLA